MRIVIGRAGTAGVREHLARSQRLQDRLTEGVRIARLEQDGSIARGLR